MSGWRSFCEKVINEDYSKGDYDGINCSKGNYSEGNHSEANYNPESMKRPAKSDSISFGVYPDSIHKAETSFFFIGKEKNLKVLIILGKSGAYGMFDGSEQLVAGKPVKVCSLSIANSKTLRKVFPFTGPCSHKGCKTTIGLGDRLGLASPGHLRLIRNYPVFPVIAQQSIRELNLTGRTFDDVLASATWAVFQEGYTGGFGADGDHLKSDTEVRMALDSGFTMITLDCSEHINNKVTALSQSEIDRMYLLIPETERERLESGYLGKEFILTPDMKITYNRADLKKIALIYLNAIKFTIDIYHRIINQCGRDIDFEMSVDETLTPTTPESHFFVASGLISGGVRLTSLAPRFCGEFQKGIDYKGDIEQFEKELIIHNKIAGHFGYKLSIHSGSDKFSVFPAIGRVTGGNCHVKTAGTNWLEAVRIIAQKNPSLFRRMYDFAAKNLSEAKKYYHIGADAGKIPDIRHFQDAELPELLNIDDSRQVLHITYGLILTAKNPDGSTMFKDEIYQNLNGYEEEYYQALEKHIGRHLTSLGFK